MEFGETRWYEGQLMAAVFFGNWLLFLSLNMYNMYIV